MARVVLLLLKQGSPLRPLLLETNYCEVAALKTAAFVQ